LSARPAAKMFLAAFTSRSWTAPHAAHARWREPGLPHRAVQHRDPVPGPGPVRGPRSANPLLPAAYPPKVAVPALANTLKAVPARRIRSQFTGQVNRHIMHGHLWSPSHFAASRGGAPLSIIQQHIEQQRTPVSATSGLTPP